MDIYWHGHTCFRLRGRDTTIVADPYDRSIGFPPLKLAADVVTVSSEHPYFASVASVTANGDRLRRIDGPGEYEVAGALIEGVATFRDKEHGKLNGKNTAYMIHLDDVSVCHLGTLGHKLTSNQIDALKDADILLIPVGGGGALTAPEAAEVVSQLEPRIVIPMQYGTPGMELDSVERFCKELAVEDATVQPRLQITRTGLPVETRIVLLAPPEAKR